MFSERASSAVKRVGKTGLHSRRTVVVLAVLNSHASLSYNAIEMMIVIRLHAIVVLVVVAIILVVVVIAVVVVVVVVVVAVVIVAIVVSVY